MFLFQEGLFRVHWTELVLYECIKDIEKNEPVLRDSIRKQEGIIREKFQKWLPKVGRLKIFSFNT